MNLIFKELTVNQLILLICILAFHFNPCLLQSPVMNEKYFEEYFHETRIQCTVEW